MVPTIWQSACSHHWSKILLSPQGLQTSSGGTASVLSPGLGLALLNEGSSFGWHEQKGLQNQGEESGPVSEG